MHTTHVDEVVVVAGVGRTPPGAAAPDSLVGSGGVAAIFKNVADHVVEAACRQVSVRASAIRLFMPDGFAQRVV